MSLIPVISIPQIGALIVVAIATVTDFRTGKIYNILTFPAALIGIVTVAVCNAMATPDAMTSAAIAGVLTSVGGWIAGVLLIVACKTLMKLKDFGLGDSKLMGALGAFIGAPLVLGTFLYFCATYAIFSLGWLSLVFPWRQLPLAYVAKDLKVLNLERFNEVRKSVVHLAPLIAIGLVTALLLQHPTLQFMGFEK